MPFKLIFDDRKVPICIRIVRSEEPIRVPVEKEKQPVRSRHAAEIAKLREFLSDK